MKPRTRILLFLIGAFALPAVPGSLSAQGVTGSAKISATSGGFGGTLDMADFFGTSETAVGDLDGDGVEDLAVGAEEDDDGGTNTGAVWVLFMNANGTVKSSAKIGVGNGFTGAELLPGDDFGCAVAGIGDLDGDNVPDLAVGARSADDGGLSAGAVWIVFLNADGSVKGKQLLDANNGGFAAGDVASLDQLGRSVALLGTLNGRTTIAAGASGADGLRGAVWILQLNADGTINTKTHIGNADVGSGLDVGDTFGTATAGIGDLDHDGNVDLAVGAPLDDDGDGTPGGNRGAVWILFLDGGGAPTRFSKISTTAGNFGGSLASGDQFGRSLALVGDLGCDGRPELAVGAYQADDGGPDRGAVWILQLAPAGTVVGQERISSTQGSFGGTLDNNDQFGTSLAALGDFDGDGLPDIAVGAPNDDDGTTDAGAVWLLYLSGWDGIPPDITCPGDISVDADPGLCQATVTFNVQAADNCPGVTADCLPPSGSVFSGGSTTVTCTATDAYANTATCSFAVTVIDTQPPILTCPGDISVPADPEQCAAVVSYPLPGVTDNCNAELQSQPDCNPPSGSTFQKGVTTVTCTAFDDNENQGSCTFTVTVNDTQAPIIACPGNITVPAAAGQCGADVSWTAPTVNDNCPGVGVPTCTPASGSTFPGGTTPVTCTVLDASNNTASCSFNVTVLDTQPPSITCPGNVTVPTDPNLCSATATWSAPAVSDNCPGVGVPSCTPPSGSTFQKGTSTVTCTVLDASNNSATCTFSVTVNDTQPPSIACPSNQTVPTAPNVCTAAVAWALPVVSDNCPGVGLPSCAPPSGSTFQKGTTTVTCSVTDASSNTGSCTFSVTVVDAQPPSIACPGNIQVPTAPNLCSATATWSTPVVSDNCPGVGAPTCTPPSGSIFQKGATPVLCTVTDASGNTAACTFTVTVVDTQPPTIVCPSSTTVPTAPNLCSATVTWAPPAVGDNCPGIGVPICAPPSGSTFQKGTTAVTCSVLDASGNSASCGFSVTVVDVQPPSIACPSNLVRPNDPGLCSAVVTWTAPIVSDNCPGVGVPVCTPPSGTTFPKGTAGVTCSVADASGNKSTCAFTVTVNDVEPPQLTVPGAITVNADYGVCGKYAAGFSLGTATANDNCPGVTLANNAPGLFPVGTTIVTWTATDASGNTRSATQSVTVIDNQPPSVYVYLYPTTLIPSNQTMRNVTAYVTVSDNCPGTSFVLYSVTSSDPDAGLFNGDLPNDIQGAGINTADTQFLLRAERRPYTSRTYYVRYRGMDSHGNSALDLRLVVVPANFKSGDDAAAPKDVTLDQNYPNPFNPTTRISYGIPEAGNVRLTVYDALGRQVATLADGMADAGRYSVEFDASGLPSGTYTAVLEAAGRVVKRTMSLVK